MRHYMLLLFISAATLMFCQIHQASGRLFTDSEKQRIPLHLVTSLTPSSQSTTTDPNLCFLPQLRYFCGPVLTGNIKFYPLYHSPDITAAFQTNLTHFLIDIGTTPWSKVVSEYSDASGNFILGSWAYAQAFQGNGADCSSSPCTITDAQIQTIVLQQYTSIFPGTICPTHNVHILFFTGKGYTIDRGGGALSCQVFCAYHGAIHTGNALCPTMTYSVYPYMGSDGPCGPPVCGFSTEINNLYSSMSHEIAETITDPEVTFAVTPAAPLGWYDQVFGESGDMCAYDDTTTTALNGNKYWVQKIWSNQKRACTSTPYFVVPPLIPSIVPPTCSCARYIIATTT